jgi:TatD DNase family protein
MSNELLPPLIDTHCHLDFPDYDQDRDAVVQRCLDQQVRYIINVGSDVANSRNAVNISRRYENVYACVGCHPHDADGFTPEMLRELSVLCREPKVKAIGEIGLDYYRNLSAVENQKKVFRSLLGLARDMSLPVVVHSRQAHADTMAILADSGVSSVIVHCFSGDEAFLTECMARSYYVSFTANITYKKSEALRKVVAACPLERMCLETDAPYLSPEGYRGKRNEPSFVRSVAEAVSGIKSVGIDEVCRATTENARRFFGI